MKESKKETKLRRFLFRSSCVLERQKIFVLLIQKAKSLK